MMSVVYLINIILIKDVDNQIKDLTNNWNMFLDLKHSLIPKDWTEEIKRHQIQRKDTEKIIQECINYFYTLIKKIKDNITPSSTRTARPPRTKLLLSGKNKHNKRNKNKINFEKTEHDHIRLTKTNQWISDKLLIGTNKTEFFSKNNYPQVFPE